MDFSRPIFLEKLVLGLWDFARNNTEIYSIPEIDNRARFWNSFCKIWSQNQDPDLSFACAALTRRDAPIGAHFEFFASDLSKNGFRDFGILPEITPEIYSIPEMDNRARFWNSFCKIWSQNQDPGLSFAASALSRRDASIPTHLGFFSPQIWGKIGFGISGFWPPVWPLFAQFAFKGPLGREESLH